jgi:hypothetical protein
LWIKDVRVTPALRFYVRYYKHKTYVMLYLYPSHTVWTREWHQRTYRGCERERTGLKTGH